MSSEQQSERETCRVIVLRANGSEVLLTDSDSGLLLPSVEIPRWERVAENLTAALQRECDCDAVCLFTLACPASDPISEEHRYEVLECRSDRRSAGGGAWKPVRSLTASCFHREPEFRAVQQCMRQLKRYEGDPTAPFARTGWLTTLQDWISSAIRPLALELVGPLRQFNAGPAFNLTRFETNGPALWFKAVGEPNQREFAITQKLAELLPTHTARILASKPEWNGWLSLDVHGRSLGEAQEVEDWELAAADLAKLQIESISPSHSFLPLGAHDLRPEALLPAIGPFFDLVARLMERQPKTPPAILSASELGLTKVLVDDALTLLTHLRIPITVGHMDLNPRNIIISANGSVFLDWAEAYVGQPFFSLEYLLEHFRRQSRKSDKFERRIVDAYKARWRPFLSDDCISEALTLSPLAAIFAYAVGIRSWKDEQALGDAKVAGYFRSLARRMNREAMALEGRSSCLS